MFATHDLQETPSPYDRYNCAEAEKLQRMRPISPKKTKSHPQVPYLRSAPLRGVIEYLQDNMIYPCAVKAKDMPTKAEWNNFPSVLYKAHAVYCALEGLSRSSDKAREVLLYFFYGQYGWETKKYVKGADGKRQPSETGNPNPRPHPNPNPSPIPNSRARETFSVFFPQETHRRT